MGFWTPISFEEQYFINFIQKCILDAKIYSNQEQTRFFIITEYTCLYFNTIKEFDFAFFYNTSFKNDIKDINFQDFYKILNFEFSIPTPEKFYHKIRESNFMFDYFRFIPINFETLKNILKNHFENYEYNSQI